MKSKAIKIRVAISALIICLTLFGRTYAQTKMERFSGTWALNEDKSDFGRLTAASATKIKTLRITQKIASITIMSGDEAMKSTMEIDLSGGQSHAMVSEVVSGIPNILTVDLKLQLISRKSFKTANRDPLGMFASQEKSYSLSDDGKTLTIEYDYKNEKGEQMLAGKLVYDQVLEGN